MCEPIPNLFFESKSPLQDSPILYEVSDTIFECQSKFAKVSIVKSPQFNVVLFLDQEVQSSSSDEHIYHETLVHPLMNSLSSLPNKNVLVIGGAEGGTAREVLKWDESYVSHVDWVDIDEELYAICRQHLKYCDESLYSNTRLKFYPEDVMKFLAPEKERDAAYDIIVIDLPDPDPNHCQSTDLYGDMFWAAVHRSLKKGGGIVSHAGYADPKSNLLSIQSNANPNDAVNVGLQMIAKANNTAGHSYHTFIPCFQAEWGFWMNLPPSPVDNFPKSCKLCNLDYQSAVFNWS